MHILAHRGLWKQLEDKNTIASLRMALNSKFGLETDVRDFCGSLVISHDMADSNSEDFHKLLKAYDYVNKPYLAINVKSDGIGLLMDKMLKTAGITNYFFFDMSFPEMYLYGKSHLPYFTRQSEFEKEPLLYKESKGVWMDEFESPWIREEHVVYHINNGKMVSIISPELHHQEHKAKWAMYKSLLHRLGEIEQSKFLLCTDMPEAAREFFYE